MNSSVIGASLVTIDRKRKKLIRIELRDKNGHLVEVEEIADKLSSFVLDKMDTEGSTCITQVAPLMGDSMLVSVNKILGSRAASVLLTIEPIRYAFLNTMSVGFYMYRFLQKNDIKIHTIEEDISDEKLHEYELNNQVHSVATAGMMAGLTATEVIEEILKTGIASKEDLHKMGISENILEKIKEKEREQN